MAIAKSTLNHEEFSQLISELEHSSHYVHRFHKVINSPINIESSKAKVIKFANVTFTHRISISSTALSEKHEHHKTIEFHNCIFEGGLIISDSKIHILHLISCKGSSIDLSGLTVYVNFVIQDCSVQRITLHKDHSLPNISLGDNETGNMFIEDLKCKQLYIQTIDGDFNLSLMTSIPFSKTNIEGVSIRFNQHYSGKLDINSLELFRLQFFGYSQKCFASFTDLIVHNVNFDWFINDGLIKFSKIAFPVNSKFRAVHSDFGKMKLYDIDFRNCPNYTLISNNYDSIQYSSVFWCDNLNDSKENGMTPFQKMDVFKQLKGVSAIQHDKRQELSFFALEMDSFRTYLKTEQGNGNDKFILGFNSFTNKFGQSWSRAAVIILLSVFIGYYSIKFFLGFNIFDFKYTLSNLSEILEAANPIRTFKDSYGDWIPGNAISIHTAKIMDSLMRVWLSLMYYQLIKAFRKYVEK